MSALPNRAKRREMAKSLGLLKRRSKMSWQKYIEELSRSIAAGKEISRLNEEENLRNQDEINEKRLKEKVQQLVESGMSESAAIEQAEKMINR